MEDEEDLENLRRALRGHNDLHWATKFLPKIQDPTISVSMSGMQQSMGGSFDTFAEEIAIEMRKDSLLKGVHTLLCCRELGTKNAVSESKVTKESIKREMEIEGATFNVSRSKIESKLREEIIYVFSFEEISEVEDMTLLSRAYTDAADLEREEEMKEFKISELSVFIEDNVRLRIYVTTDGYVKRHTFAFK